MTKNYYITTPIYYVNDAPHIGHAYTSIACDVLARFKRLDGYRVKFLTGTDEHGQKIEKSANKAGIPPQQFVDKYAETFRALGKIFNFSNDDFIRTSEERHKETVRAIWQKLVDSGSIYLGKYAGWYAVRDEAFYSESELIDGKAPTGADVEWLEEPSYFFNLSAWQDRLLEFYEKNPGFIAPESKRNEVISFVKGGLHDLSVSRTSFNWGIHVPGDEKHVIYVWLDALFNYYSAVNTDEERDLWPCNLHILGKDILRFHAVYWPAFLMAAEMQLPKRVFAHGWWTNEGVKMSKSLGNALDPIKMVEEFGLDFVRYFLMREMPFGNDGSYSKALFIQRINAELCNNIGNLVQRVLSFINKNCRAVVPANIAINDTDKKLLDQAYATIENMRLQIDQQALQSAFEEVIKLGSLANEYIDYQAPWALRKTDPVRMEAVLYTLCECIRCIGIMLQPIIPDSAAKILDLLAVKDRDFTALNAESALVPGTTIPTPGVIFPRIVE